MKKRSRLYYNTTIAIVNQAVVLVCNFILPRQIIVTYGSATNGLISSISQYLGFILLMDMGIGAVVRSALYKPLANNDYEQVSRISKSARHFYNKVGIFLLLYIALLCVLFPIINKSDYGYSYIVPLILAISISSITQYFIGIVNQLLLEADQRSYVQLILNTCAVILNTVISVCLMRKGASIQTVKFFSAIVLLVKPLGMVIFVKNNYKIDKKIVVNEEPIKQKWNGLAQHVAAYVLSNTDIVVLSVFSSMTNVSIYTVYHLVVAGVRQCIMTVMTGVDALFGNLYAKKSASLNAIFDTYEWIVHTGVCLLFSVTAVLICPFVGVYTKGVHDANYIIPSFSLILTAALGMYCIRLPYNTMVLAAGHYKETQLSAIIEAILNVVISVIFVGKYGLVGVAIGTLIAMIYRTIYLAYYLQKAILFRKFDIFLKHLVIDAIMVVMIYFSTKWIAHEVSTYLEWIIMALPVMAVAVIVVIIVNSISYRKQMIASYKYITTRWIKR